MFDFISSVRGLKKPVKKLIAFSPEQCPFRSTVPWYDGTADYCGYLKSLHKMVEKRITFGGRTLFYEEEAEGFCVCTDELWLEGCPLLNSSFMIEKN